MKVLKFEGDLFADIEGYQKAIQIIIDSTLASKTIAVIPANLATEKELFNISQTAQKKDESYRDSLETLENEYLQLARGLITVQEHSGVLSFLKQRFNELDNLYKGIFLLGECSESTLESIQCYGPIFSSYLISAACKNKQILTRWIDARDLMVATTLRYRKNIDLELSSEKIMTLMQANTESTLIVPGAIAKSRDGSPIYLSKGGADQTMSIIACVLNVEELEIWTTTSGMMTANPLFVNNARSIEHINYEESMELSHYETTLFYPPALKEIFLRKIPISIKTINNKEAKGTLISDAENKSEETIKGISSLKNISLVNVEGSGMIGIPGFSKRLFESLNDHGINIILITQGASEHSICVGVHSVNSVEAKKIIDNCFEEEIKLGSINPIVIESELSILALVGNKMKSHPGVSGRMFAALGRNGINIRAIAQGSNEINISAVIKTSETKKALNVLHEAFFENTKREINLFIIGTGNVGKKLLRQIEDQLDMIDSSQKLRINIAGLCNSRKMVVDENSISIDEWENKLAEGNKANPYEFLELMTSLNLRNSVLVDITANADIPSLYPIALKKSMSVVACNKIAASGKYENYKLLKDLALSYNCKFLFETNVGAALPIIGTLNDLIKSGDKINKIEAVLSGTLNFVFNNYDGSRSFAKVVKQAQDEGYTEPDPRLDLSGMDVMRKIMILLRESGNKIEMNDIVCNSFLPASCMEGSVENFYIELEKNEPHFLMLLTDANKNNAKLKFVASYKDGITSAGLQHISSNSEMFHLYGKDNIILFHTERYNEQPLVIKGAGAGAEVTASGVFADILRAINN